MADGGRAEPDGEELRAAQRERAQPLLQAKGLDGFFSQVFGGDSFERKKPDPLPLAVARELLAAHFPPAPAPTVPHF